MGVIEKSYGKVLKTALKAVNPLKKAVIKTECRVHKFINCQGIIILEEDGYTKAAGFFKNHIEELNSGVVWADQDLKNSSHFYNPKKQKGLYGSSNALKECLGYYAAALTWWHHKDIRKSIFYLGAACHLIQDVTVPQHVSVKLLKSHRKYEQWVVRMHDTRDEFKCKSGGIYLDTIKDFIETNAGIALYVYDRNKQVMNVEQRFYNITEIVLNQAQKTTAGMLKMFYDDVCSLYKSNGIENDGYGLPVC